MNRDPTEIEYVAFDEAEPSWPEPTVRPNLRTSVDFSRDLSVDIEDVGSDLLDRATETPPHLHVLGAVLWFAS